MDFKDLSYVIAIAKTQNITKAADMLYVTQPTLTKFLQNLEREMGQKLFKKLGNRFVLTYAGERYVAKATEILNLKKELDQEMGDIIRQNAGLLKIAFPTMRGTYMLPCTLPIFRSLYPNVRLEIREAHSSLLEENESFILQPPDQRTRQTVDQLFKSCHIHPKICLQTSNIPAAAELASQGYGACFVTETHLKHIPFKKKPVLFSVGTPNTTVDFVAAFRKGSYLSYHAQEYIKIVRDFT